jgi:NitT/TauT family transport system ATP-binding protein
VKNGDRAASLRLVVDGVSKAFDNPGGVAQLVLHDVSFEVGDGEFVALVGASGCGKTTMLRIMAGLTPATAGHVLLGGQAVRGPSKACGFVFQSDSLMPWRTVNANVGISLEIRHVPRRAREDRVADVLRLVGLQHWGKHFPSELSGGMRQRVNIARALAVEPSILLMDEPFAALDAQTREIMQDELQALCARLGATVVFVTHQIEEAVFLSDRVVVLGASPGVVREVITVPFRRPRSPTVKRTPEFAGIVDDVWKLIASEVKRSVQKELEHHAG